MNEKKIYTEQEAKEYAESASNTITIRTYDNGSSDVTTRKSTKKEKEILTNIIFGALLAIKNHNLGGIAVQSAKDTAEFTADLMIPHINGYLSVYNKIGDFIELYK